MIKCRSQIVYIRHILSHAPRGQSALANANEAVAAHVEALRADSLPVPEDQADARLINV